MEEQVCGSGRVLHDGIVTSLGTTAPRAATRASGPTWRDPRLWVGLLIVATSVLVGARMLARADESVSVWTARRDLVAGAPVGSADLVATQVRFLDVADEERYLSAAEPPPQDAVLTRDVAAGELLPRSALGAEQDSGLLTVPLALPALAVPPDVDAGARVDVWVQVETATGRVVSRPLLTDVVVVAAPVSADAFGVTGDRQLVLGVDESQTRQLGQTLAAVGEATITIVGRD